MLLTGVLSVLGELSLEAHLFFFLGDVVDGYLETPVLEDDALDDKDAAVLVDMDGHALFFVGGPFGRLVDEVCDALELVDGEDVLCLLQIGVGYQVAVLGEEVVHQYLLLVLGEHSQSLA